MVIHNEQGLPIGTPDNAFQCIKSAPGLFIGGTAGARGDHDGASDPTTLFTVVGDVVVRVFGVCTKTVVGTGTIEVGVTGNTAILLPQVADASTIAANDVWIDATVGEVGAAHLADVPEATVIVNGLDIIETIASANLTDGEIYYVCLWRALTPGSSVTAA